jgi:hypothetical protein
VITKRTEDREATDSQRGLKYCGIHPVSYFVGTVPESISLEVRKAGAIYANHSPPYVTIYNEFLLFFKEKWLMLINLNTMNLNMNLILLYRSRDSSVGIALGYELDDRSSRARFPVGAESFSLHHCVLKGSGAHPASYPMGIMGSFHGGEEAGA